jgi:hypothetical protein
MPELENLLDTRYSELIESISYMLSDMSDEDIKLIPDNKLKILGIITGFSLHGPIYYDSFNLYVLDKDDANVVLKSSSKLVRTHVFVCDERGVFVNVISYVNNNEVFQLLNG